MKSPGQTRGYTNLQLVIHILWFGHSLSLPKFAIFLPSICGKGEPPKDKKEICKATSKENKIIYFILISFCLSDRRSIFMNEIMYMMCGMFNITLQQIILEKLIQGLNLPFKMNSPTYSEIMLGKALAYGYKNLNKVILSTSRYF